MAEQCPICKYALEPPGTPVGAGSGRIGYPCLNCGKFSLSREALLDYLPLLNENPDKAAILSHAIRKRHKKDEWVIINSDTIEQILKSTKLPTPVEQADNLIIWLGDNLKTPGKNIEVDLITHQAIMGAANWQNVNFILKHLREEGLIDGTFSTAPHADVQLSYSGWKRYEELIRGISDSRKAFMAMEYGDPDLDEIVDNYFRPAVSLTGFELIRLDDPGSQEAGLIDDRLRVEIRTSRFLIADLTHDNEGAYWEAGFAEGLGKPVIYTCEKEKFKEMKTHFDTNHHLTVTWDKDYPSQAAEELKATIRATLPDEAKLEDDQEET